MRLAGAQLMPGGTLFSTLGYQGNPTATKANNYRDELKTTNSKNATLL